MKIDVAKVRRLLKECDFRSLFRDELGWDNYSAKLDIPLDGTTLSLSAVAEKRGFQVFACPTIPERAARLKLDRQLTKSAREHLVIYVSPDRKEQIWEWVRREHGQPAASRDYRFHAGQSGDALIQKLEGLAIGLDEEERLTLPEVAGRVKAALDVDKITKRFYDRFKTEHASFMKFIKGIKHDPDLQWYTSLMLNRLMFVYFIQKKGFLDGDVDYLRNRMARLRQQHGKDKFYSFYRYFLLRLFHEGLGQSPKDPLRKKDLDALLGKVPFLNGGFFEVHDLEEKYPQIDIPDAAFEKLFEFFDAYRWHLDERPLRDDREINPDVVGYIFEKYINQKQMGAYYTKEDITEYISKNTIIPFLFDAAEKKCAIAFKPESALWRMLRDDPDRYIYAAVRHGVVTDRGDIVPLPAEIETGVTDVSKRGGWNKPAPQPFALPTETWREHVARRQRCLEIREKLRRGDVNQINDLITLNLDIWQFARDAIVNSEGPELLRAFYRVIAGHIPAKSNEKYERGLSVLDPTCGSGAFLFAALRILETLYSDCLERMRRFVDELEHSGDKHRPEKYADFKAVLAEIEEHPNERYFALKGIIINNLFGVDIMEEAVEICKLRLFLKLVAQVERVEQIEPLPDIDFNIRAGNTLVGYVSLDEVRRSQEGQLGFGDKEMKRIEEDALIADGAYKRFRETQVRHGGMVTAKDKAELRKRLAKLDAELDRYLAGEYGVKLDKANGFDAWKASHQPFHWLVEFFGIMRDGGFDVVIGNPPYVEYRKVSSDYRVEPCNYTTATADNLYAFCVERAGRLLCAHGAFGMIIPSSAVGLDETLCLRESLLTRFSSLYVSTYSIRPAKLFEGVDQRLCIILGDRRALAPTRLFSSRYHHWSSDERDQLFPVLAYVPSLVHPRLRRIVQVGDEFIRSVLQRIEQRADRELQSFYAPSGKGFLSHYHRSPRYWIRAMDFEQYFKSDTRSRSIHHFRDLLFRSEDEGKAACAIINSSLYFVWFLSVCNGRNLTGVDVGRFPVGAFEPIIARRLAKLFDQLMENYKANSIVRQRKDCEYQEFRPSLAKPIIDRIDAVLGEHFGFPQEEVDRVLNFEIKYRTGDAADGDDE